MHMGRGLQASFIPKKSSFGVKTDPRVTFGDVG